MTNFSAWGLICQICFKGLTPEECVVDIHGDRWDVCPGFCAIQSNIIEEDRWESEGGTVWPERVQRGLHI